MAGCKRQEMSIILWALQMSLPLHYPFPFPITQERHVVNRKKEGVQNITEKLDIGNLFGASGAGL